MSDNYRILNVGEQIERGDEWEGHDGKWRETTCVDAHVSEGIYRRKVEAPKGPAAATVEPGEGYRLIDTAKEKIGKDDEWFNPVLKTWERTLNFICGKFAPDTFYRRKVAVLEKWMVAEVIQVLPSQEEATKSARLAAYWGNGKKFAAVKVLSAFVCTTTVDEVAP